MAHVVGRSVAEFVVTVLAAACVADVTRRYSLTTVHCK